MYGLAPQLPLNTDGSVGGYELIQDYKSLTQQNLKMILFTNPGERIMDINFGVGVKTYIFNMSNQILYDELRDNVVSQTRQYLPFIKIDQLLADYVQDDESIAYLFIRYTILPIGLQDYLNLTLSPDDK